MNVAEGDMVGAIEFTDTILVEGTRRSVYFATSMDAPIESSDLLCVPWCVWVCVVLFVLHHVLVVSC